MKLTTILLIASCLQISAKSLSQTVTFSGNKVPLEKIFTSIKKQTGYAIVYNPDQVDKATPVTITAKNEPLESFIKEVLANQPFDYSITNTTIWISQKAAPTPTNINNNKVDTVLPPSDIHGRVVDSTGAPLAGANVVVKGTSKGTMTDQNGFFELKGVDENATLVISFTGYSERVYAVKGQAFLAVTLKRSDNPLDEVQVIAYGTQSKRFSVGDVTTVKSEELETQPVNNALIALQGKVAGMQITQSNGVPGSSVRVTIQGTNTISAGTDPFYVVDGVPFQSFLMPNLGAAILGGTGGSTAYFPNGAGSPMDYINPSDIESISILKDADATAIYGSRAANGAILITTKKAKAGRVTGNIDLQQGIGQVSRFLNLMNTKQYLQMRKEAINNDGLTIDPIYDYDINGTWDSTRYTDWQKVLMGNTAHYTNLSGSITGGSGNTQFLAGATFHRETTVFPGSFADQKGSFHFSLTSSSANQRFKLQLTGNYLVDNNQLPQQDLAGQAFYLAPDAPALYNPDGSINWAPSTIETSTWINPIANYTYNTYQNKTNNLIANAVISYRLLAGLELKSSFGYSNLQQNEYELFPLNAVSPSLRPFTSRNAQYSNNASNSWIVEPQVTYQRNIGKGKMNLMFGTTFQQQNLNGGIFNGTGYTSDQVLLSPFAASTITYTSNTISNYKYNAVFGRLNYLWADKYIFNLNARRDGSSRFGPSNQVYNFGAVGAGWIFTQEKFFTNKIKFLSFGKLHASYGTTGNDQIGDYKYMNLYSPQSAVIAYQGIAATRPGGLHNPYLEWEVTKKLNVGLDLGFLKDRVILNAAYYRSNSSNLLLSYMLPAQTGFASVTRNFPAKIENKGLEFTFQSNNFKNKDFSWSTNIVLTIPIDQQKLVSFPNLSNSSYASTFKIGRSIMDAPVYHYAGVNPTNGLYQFGDGKGGMTTRPDTSFSTTTTYLQKAIRYYGGLGNTFHFKGWDLSFLFSFQKGVLPNNFFGNNYSGNRNSNQVNYLSNRWQKPGDVALYQRYNSNYDFNVNQAYTNAVSSDAAFTNMLIIQLQNVSLGWQIPAVFCKRLHLQSTKLSFMAQNLFVSAPDSKFLIPQSGSNGLPPLRLLTLKLQVVL